MSVSKNSIKGLAIPINKTLLENCKSNGKILSVNLFILTSSSEMVLRTGKTTRDKIEEILDAEIVQISAREYNPNPMNYIVYHYQ